MLADLQQLLPTIRLLSLTGPGGVGKTAIARHMIAEQTAMWVDLASLRDQALLAQNIAMTAGLSEQRGMNWHETLLAGLVAYEGVLVLDNCEHLRSACANLCSALLDACPNLQILTTSRELLGLADETVYQIPTLEREAAVTLFLQRAATRLPSFTADSASQPIVETICSRLEGMPLAIELAAARVTVLSVGQIAMRLEQGLDLLASRDPTLLPRQRSMRATLDWSYLLLTVHEQTLLRRVALFAASFDLEALEAVYELPQSLNLLEELIDQSLVLVADRTEQGSVRYRLHEVTRQYAVEQLQAAGEEPLVRQRLLVWAIALAEQAESRFGTPDATLWMQRLRQELPNLRVALDVAQMSGDAEALLRLAGAMRHFWNDGDLAEGRRRLTIGLQRMGTQPFPGAVKALNTLSFLAYRQGEYAEMQQATEQALELAMRFEDSFGLAEAHYRFGIYAEYQAQYAEARSQYQQSMALYQEIGDQRGVANTLNGLAHVARLENQLPEARGYYQQALQIARSTNDQRTLMLLLISLANLLLEGDSHDRDQAEGLYQESLIHIQALGAASYEPYVINGLGEIAQLRGDLLTALSQHTNGLERSRILGLRDMEAQFLLRLGLTTIAQGDYIAATQYARDGLQSYATLGRDERTLIAIQLCAGLVQLRGHPNQALRLFLAANIVNGKRGLYAFDQSDRELLTKLQAQAQAQVSAAELQAAETLAQQQSVPQLIEAALAALYLPPRATQLPTLAGLHIFSLGAFRVFRGQYELTNEDWMYSKTRDLLIYLLHIEHATKAEIGMALWPDASEQQLKQNFRMAIYHLRRALGGAEWITFEQGRYAFNRKGSYWHDLHAFEHALEQAKQPHAQQAYLLHATELYQGDLAYGEVEHDALPIRREQLHQRAILAFAELGDSQLKAGKLTEATATLRRLLMLDSYYEPAHRDLMRCLTRQGTNTSALAHYHAFSTLLERELGTAPAAETRELAEAIRQGKSV